MAHFLKKTVKRLAHTFRASQLFFNREREREREREWRRHLLAKVVDQSFVYSQPV